MLIIVQSLFQMVSLLNLTSLEFYVYGFYFSGAVNLLAPLIHSHLFRSRTLARFYPQLFSTEGLIAIMVFGLVMIAVGLGNNADLQLRQKISNAGGYAALALVGEKVFYVASWLWFMYALQGKVKIRLAFQEDFLAGLFYAFYGLSDFLFGLYFLSVWIAFHHGIEFAA